MGRSQLILFIFLLSLSLYAYNPERTTSANGGTVYDGGEKGKKQLSKPNTNDFNNFIAINQIFMWVGNNGMGSHDPRTDASGFYWPGGENATISAIYEDGLIWGAKVDTQIRVNGSVYRHGLQAGKILPNGEADNPNLEKYRIYKIRKGWESLPPGPRRDLYEKDYHEWPIEDGAPYVLDKDRNKIPDFVGDEVLWCVSNDMDSLRSLYTYGTLPMGLEQQMTIFGFNRSGDLGDMVFKKYTLINKGTLTLKDMVLAYWSDTDLGNAEDDYTGCDTTLKLGYTYNGDNNDVNYYGTTPPAVGYVFFQGPIVESIATDSAKFLTVWRHGYKNLPMTGFTFYINNPASPYQDPDQGVAAGSVQFYNYMTGKDKRGNQFIDPNTGLNTKIILAGTPGDPLAGISPSGWYEGFVGWPGGSSLPGDRRHLMSSGSFTLAPGDTQEVVIGIVIARGSNNLNSITQLKSKTKIAQTAYDNDFSSTVPPLEPIVTSVADDKRVTLSWEPNAEDYNVVDPFITGKGKADTTYTFEGYRIWQFEDESGRNPKLLKVFDIKNNVTKVTQILDFNGVKVEQTVFEMPNQGIARFFSTNFDKISYTPLINGTPYYFGVTAFGYSKDSDPQYLENPVKVIKVIPGKIGYDSSFTYRYGSYIDAKQTAGIEDGNVRLFVVNPLALTGDTYKIIFDSTRVRNFSNTADSSLLAYSLLNVSKSPIDTLFKQKTDFSSDSINKFVTDGFTLIVNNTGLDQINTGVLGAKVKSVLEVANGTGNLETPLNVLNNLNSTQKWIVKTGGVNNTFIWQTKAYDVGLGLNDYEIRFSGTSEFYVSRMAFSPTFANSSKLGKIGPLDTTNIIYAYGNPLPFQIFQLGPDPNSTTDDKRLLVKILDKALSDSTRAIPDSLWSRTVGGNWEEIYAYEDPDIDATAQLPLTSGTSLTKDHKFGQFKLSGELPEPGTVIRLSTYKPLVAGNQFMVTAPKAILSGVDDKSNDVHFPNTYALHQNYPNPFNPNTTISYSIANPGLVTVKIFNILGEEVVQLVNEYKNSGSYSVNFDASRLSSGIYFYTLNSGSFVSTKKMVVLK